MKKCRKSDTGHWVKELCGQQKQSLNALAVQEFSMSALTLEKTESGLGCGSVVEYLPTVDEYHKRKKERKLKFKIKVGQHLMSVGLKPVFCNLRNDDARKHTG